MISIIIPAYNEEKYIGRTLESIKAQTVGDYEVIVVANGCTDKTAAHARKYTMQVYEIAEPNVSAARNAGAQNANGEVIIFLDADTRLAPNALAEVRKQFSHDTAVATLITHPNVPKLHYKLLHHVKNVAHRTKLYAGSSGAIITTGDLFNKINGFNTQLHLKENRMFIRQLMRLGKYKVIKNTHAITSTRRYERWGLIKTTFFWLKNDFKILLFKKDSKYDAVR